MSEMNTEKFDEACSTDAKILFGSNPGRVLHIYKDGVRAAGPPLPSDRGEGRNVCVRALSARMS